MADDKPDDAQSEGGHPVPPPPTFWESGMQQLALDSFRQSLPLCNDVLTKLVILNTALLGTFTGLKELPVPIWFRVLAVVAFTVSLLTSLWGVYPRTWKIDHTVPDFVQAAYEDALKVKSRWLKVASISLVVGFGVALFGLVYGACCPDPPPPVPTTR